MQKKRRRYGAAIAVSVFCLLMAFVPVKAEEANPWEDTAATDWMENIDGSLKITQINIPGTHDSGTKNVTLSNYSQCQNTTIEEQLNHGIRFLDMRMEADASGNLYIVHGTTDCSSDSGGKLYLNEVMTDCYNFLDAHPTETIIMSMKKDDGDATDEAFQQYIHNYINQNPEYWYLQNGKPVLNDVRGKIVLARRYYDNNGYGDTKGGLNFLWGDQGGSDVVDTPWAKVAVTGLTGLWVQDRYEYSADDKWTAVKAGLDTPPDESNRANSYFLNFMSSAGTKMLGIPTSTPSKIASSVNENFLNYELTRGKAYGWVIMDFETEELARKVFESNTYTEIPEKVQIALTKDALTESKLNITDAQAVTEDLKLPTTGEAAGAGEGTVIVWSSSAPDVIRTDGTVLRPSYEEGDKAVILTATITSGSYSDTKTFTVTVTKSAGASYGVLRVAIRDAEASYNEAAEAGIYSAASLEALETAILTAKELAEKEGVDLEITAAQIQAAADALDAAAAKELELKSLQELEENLLARYPLTEDSKDATANHNDGTAAGVTFNKENGAVITGSGKLQSYISLPTAMFDGKDRLTISFWAKDTGTETNRNQAVFGLGSGTDSNPNSQNVYKYFLVNTSYNSCLKAVVTVNSYSGETGFTSECAFPKNEWVHITCAFDGTSFTLYKNGELVGTKDTGIKLTDFGTNRVAYIGNSIWGGNDNDYIGSVKDFRVYNGVLASEQIAEVYEYVEPEDTEPEDPEPEEPEVPDPVSYIVSFDAANGGEPVTVSVEEGAKAEEPENPVRAGYIFAGWFLEEEETAFDFNTPITSNITLLAKWTLEPEDPTPEDPAPEDPEPEDPEPEDPAPEDPEPEDPEPEDPAPEDPEPEDPEPEDPAPEDPEPAVPNPDTDTQNPGEQPSGGAQTGDQNTAGQPSGGTQLVNQNGTTQQQAELTSIAQADVTVAKAAYNGKVQKPKVKVTYAGSSLILNQDYTVAYGGQKNVGQGTVTITGMGSYTGEKVVAFNILPKKNKISKLTVKAGGKLAVKLSKSKGAKGYEISYATNKKFKSAKKVKVKGTTCTLKKLKKGKTYYVRVRPYAKIGGKTIYGDYSKTVKKKITK